MNKLYIKITDTNISRLKIHMYQTSTGRTKIIKQLFPIYGKDFNEVTFDNLAHENIKYLMFEYYYVNTIMSRVAGVIDEIQIDYTTETKPCECDINLWNENCYSNDPKKWCYVKGGWNNSECKKHYDN